MTDICQCCGQPIGSDVLTPQQRRILAEIGDENIMTRTLIRRVWGEREPLTAEIAIRVQISRINQRMGRQVIMNTYGGYRRTKTKPPGD